ncbi:TonB-dependent receptor [Aurantiacibacter xanthus]|nr:TonB-dependent receptor [Aurantiacibacter xanthus]
MKISMRGLSSLALAVAISGGWATAGWAQQAAGEGGEGARASTDEIIVTAQGREQRLQDVPVAVSVVSGETLAEQGIRSLQDVSQRLGNVKITQGTQVNSINIRGVGSGENPGFEQAVATFSDGVYRSRSRASVAALFDIERLEVLKGPQGTFFGANASAGALSITTRKPDGTFDWNASGLYATDGEYSFEAGVSVPLGETLSGRIAGRASGTNGWVELANGGDAPHDDSLQGRVSLRWEPSANWRTDFRFDIAQSRTDDNAAFQLLNCPPPPGFPMSAVCGQILAANDKTFGSELDFVSEGVPSFQDFDFHEAALTNSLDTGAGTVRSITAYNWMKVDSELSLVPAFYPTAVGGNVGFPISQNERYRFFSQELRYESETGGTFEYLFGGYYQHARLQFGGLSNFYFLPFGAVIENALAVDFPNITPSTPLASGYTSTQSEDTFSAFAAVTIRPTDNLRINLGARYSRVSKDGTRDLTAGTSLNGDPASYVPFDNGTAFSGTIGAPITGSVAFCAIIGCALGDFPVSEITDDAFMPSVSLQYDVSPDAMVYAKYSRGFKAGGFSANSAADVFGPETVDAYEAGIKGSLAGNVVTYSLAAFRMDYQGLQETVFDSNAAASVSNVAEARSQGVELGLGLRASDWLRLNADVAYLDSVYRNYPNAECTKLEIANTPRGQTCVQDLSGSPRSYAPEWSGAVGAELMLPVSSDLDFTANPVVAFSSSYFMTATGDPLLQQEGYAKIDLRLGLSSHEGGWELALIGRNLTDKATASYRLGVPGADGSVLAMLERGRSVALQFSIRK